MLQITGICLFVLTFSSTILAGHYEMAGEITDHSALLQGRLVDSWDREKMKGQPGWGKFEYAHSPLKIGTNSTAWKPALKINDYIVRFALENLKNNTRYFYRFVYGQDTSDVRSGPIRSFRTNPGEQSNATITMSIVSGMNYHKFRKHASEEEKLLGAEGLKAIRLLQPDYFVGTGDNIYYDSPRKTSVTDLAGMRAKWQEQFSQRRCWKLFANTGTYWEKDDHDYRYDDADTIPGKKPGHKLGIHTFLEQMPLAKQGDLTALPYRTIRMSSLLQIWFLEGRDFRDPNEQKDHSEKSMWGKEQRNWLQNTLSSSTAPFKVIISPTPMVGPDDFRKFDNHTNYKDGKGFKKEGDQFFQWMKQNGFLKKGLYIVCGDRHWQYHSIHPSGFEEFATGALYDANSRPGVPPGKGTDPKAEIRQPYLQNPRSGGFIHLSCGMLDVETAQLRFDFYDEDGSLLYNSIKVKNVSGKDIPQNSQAFRFHYNLGRIEARKVDKNKLITDLSLSQYGYGGIEQSKRGKVPLELSGLAPGLYTLTMFLGKQQIPILTRIPDRIRE